jgi:hypothetical protein
MFVDFSPSVQSLREASSPLRGPAAAGGESLLDLVRLQLCRQALFVDFSRSLQSTPCWLS